MLELNRVLRAPRSEDGGWGGLRGPAFGSRTYRGVRRNEGEVEVWFETPEQTAIAGTDRHTLPMCLEIRSHSPTGFAWGYGGSGPAQLALALLVDALGNTEQALSYYQDFKREYVAKWGTEWSITGEEIRHFVLQPRGVCQIIRFHPGAIVATANALESIPNPDMLSGLRQHLRGEWGELDQHDWQVNEQALEDGSRLLSAYLSSDGTRFWIITEADRSYTTILLPEDY